jgi:hypothetical protein
VTQGYVSKLERHEDMQVSKLYELVNALGGEVEIRARFSRPGGGKEEMSGYESASKRPTPIRRSPLLNRHHPIEPP